MSISNAVTSSTDDKLVIPTLGKMFQSNIDKTNRGLAFLVNKGYFELTDLQSMLYLMDYCVEDKEDLILVGNLSKVRLKNGKIVYRQRIFFRDLSKMINCCRLFGLKIIVPKHAQVTINNMINCKDELKYLEKYAKKYGQSIDDYLLWTFKIQFHLLLKQERIYSGLQQSIDSFLKDKIGYLDRAPFIVRKYNIKEHSSSMFFISDHSNEALFTQNLEGYGYTDKNKLSDLKKGVLK